MWNSSPHSPNALMEGIGLEGPASKQRRLILLRLLLLGVVALTTYTLNHFSDLYIPAPKVFSLCIFMLLVNALVHCYFFITNKKVGFIKPTVVARTNFFQFALDFIFIILICLYTGGIASPFLFYFLFHVIMSVMLLETRGAWLYVSLISFTITAIALLQLTGFLPRAHHSSFISLDLQDNPIFVLLSVFLFNLVLWGSIFVFLTIWRGLNKRLSQFIDLDQKLKQANQQLELLNQLAKDTTSTLGFYPRLNLICHRISDIMKLKGVAIRLLDERTNLLELASACGLSEAYLNKGPVDADKSLAKALEGQPHFVPDAATDPAAQYPQDARKEGIVSMLSYPLKGREGIIGTIRLYTGERRSFSQNELDFVGALSSQAAVSIENAKIYERQKKQDEAKSEFIMMMTHELKGPLMAIQSLLEVMLNGYVGSLTKKQEELIRRVIRRIESLMEVSKGLLTIYQWQSRTPDIKFVPLSINEQIQKAVDLFTATAQEKGLTISVALPDENFIVMGTEEDIETVLNNLITNAIKYTPTGGSIFLGLSDADDQVILKVRDTGIGIDPDDIPKIFKGFFRTRKAKEMDPYGRGMGLPFVKKVVETLGGTISVRGDTTTGTEFNVVLPKTEKKNAPAIPNLDERLQ